MSSLPQLTNVNGVKADPKLLRDPSALESISSVISGWSSYVAHSLPNSIASLRKISTNSTNDYQPPINYYPDYLPHQLTNDMSSQSFPIPDGLFDKKKDVILYAAFDEIITSASNTHNCEKNQSVLLLGYPDGFQIWNVSDIDNIHELMSIRDEENIGQVTCIKSICNPRNSSKNLRDKFADVRPLICLVCTPIPQRENGHQDMFTKPKSVLKFFSLKTNQIVKALDLENEGSVVSVNCNERAIVVSLTNPPRLHILSPLTLAPLFLSPLQDVAIHPSSRAPIFALGPRLLAYSTTSYPPEIDANMDGYAVNESDGVLGTTGKYQEVAKGVAKEVVNGVKFLGDYGYQTFSAYFTNPNSQVATMPINIKNHAGSISPASRGSFSPQDSPSNGYYCNLKGGMNNGNGESGNMAGLNSINGYENDKENGAIGTVIICDLDTSCSVQKKQPSIIAHFSPHTHPVGHLSFNPTGSFLFSTSVQGHQFHIFEIVGKRRQSRSNKNLKHVYQLSRGYTNASVNDGGVGWSGDSRWCAVASGRGTIHVFAINPYGGPTHVPSHIRGWVNNVDELYKSTTQSPVVRIKTRTPLPSDSSDVNVASQGSNIYFNKPYEHYSLSSTDANVPPIDQSRRQSQYNGNLNNFHSQYNGQPYPTFHYSTFPTHYLRKPPGMCVKFLPSMYNNSKSGLNANLHAKRQAKRRSSPNVVTEGVTSNGTSTGRSGRRRTQSWSQNSINNSHSNYLGVETRDNKLDDIGYQDLLSFNPAGILTLHRLWMEKTVVEETPSQGAKDEINNNNLITLAGTQLSGSAATVANVGRALVGGAAGVVGIGMGIAGAVKKELGTLDMVSNYEDIAEWQLIRNNSWAEVKNIIEAPKKCAESESSAKRDGKKWLANAEIATHTSSKFSLPPPLWATPQFSFQVFLPGYKDAINKGEVPRSKKIEIRRDIVESVELVNEANNDEFGVKGWMNEENKSNHNKGKISKAVLVPAGKAIGRGAGDMSVNLSTAMTTSLDFTPSSPTLSAFSTKSKDRMSNGFSNGHTQQTVGDTSITPLSFEDAYHIHIGNNIPSITASSTSSPKFNKNNSSLGFSPLSSNMVANDSTFEQRSSPFTRSFSSSSIASDITYNDEADEFVKGHDRGIDDSNEGGNFFFSPDGDNEVDLPSDSVIGLHRNGANGENKPANWWV
ncbi:26_t:CDS:10 [Dentiscutata heterogama]|uniref:26_t:CDS:1 n=1 Tax=Dentiscutata heterogama TaxID=1316150 RepID=A0ACA9LRU5_9GLOM|nr:26_t:CDS:10 [Dentiscutata heterogama]